MSRLVPGVLASIALLASLCAHGGEARRCLRDGKVIITDVTCDLLGGATDLSPPIPEKHFQRGALEKQLPAQVSSIPAVTQKQPILLAQQANTASSQMMSGLFDALLIPLALILFLVVWFKHKTKSAVARRWLSGKPLVNEGPSVRYSGIGDRSMRNEPSLSRVAHSTPTDPAVLDVFASGPSEIDSTTVDCSVSGLKVKPAEWSIELIRNVEWKRFEDVCQQFYELKGIRSETTALGPDGGIDIRLFQDDSGKPTSIVQCKAWGERYVGVKPVRELLGVMTHEKVGKAFFMTSGAYTSEAKAIAEANCITLIDGAMLLMLIQRLPTQDRERLLSFATEGDYMTPTCPTCGLKMHAVKGKGDRPDFWGCRSYPRCRQKLGMRRT